MAVETVNPARSIPVRHPNVAVASEPFFVYGSAARAVIAHDAWGRFGISRWDGEVDQDLAVEGHLDDSGWTRFHLDAFSEYLRPLLVTVSRTDRKDETRVTHPEVLLVPFPHQGDAMSFGEARLDRPQDTTVP